MSAVDWIGLSAGVLLLAGSIVWTAITILKGK